jgi:hypothetical protein
VFAKTPALGVVTPHTPGGNVNTRTKQDFSVLASHARALDYFRGPLGSQAKEVEEAIDVEISTTLRRRARLKAEGVEGPSSIQKRFYSMSPRSDIVLARDGSNNTELANNWERNQAVASDEVVKLVLVEQSRALEPRSYKHIKQARTKDRSKLWTFIVYRCPALEARRAV